MNHAHRIVIASLFAIASAQAGDLKKDYFSATKPGDWVTQELSSPDGSKSEFTSQRMPDQDGHPVVELAVKVLAGPGAGADSKSIYTLPKDFNFARDWLSYGRVAEKMTMVFGGTEMPVDETTLKAIRDASKDYQGAVTFEASEKMDGHECDRYAYSVTIADPNAPTERGKLWLDPTIPFGIVRQTSESIKSDGSVASSYDIRLTGTGREQLEVEDDAGSSATHDAPKAPAVVSLLEGYNAGRIALAVEVLPGSKGRGLGITLVNKTEDEITVKLVTGNYDIPGSSPVSELKVTIAKMGDIVIGPGESSEPIPAAQRGTRGPTDGKFVLSVYEGTPLYSGSVTIDQLPK